MISGKFKDDEDKEPVCEPICKHIKKLAQSCTESYQIDVEVVRSILKEEVDVRAAEYFEEMQQDEMAVDHQKYFVCYPGVWDYMDNDLITWCSETKVRLKKGDVNGYGSRTWVELRAYALYLDLSENRIDDIKPEIDKERVQFPFEYHLDEEPEVTHLAVAVSFDVTKKSESAYILNLSVWTEYDVPKEKLMEINERVYCQNGLSQLISIYNLHQEKRNLWNQGYFVSACVSQKKIIDMLTDILPKIKDLAWASIK